MHGEEAEQQQRRVIGAVQVVEDEDDRALRGGRAQQRRDRVEELKARGVGLAGIARRRPRPAAARCSGARARPGMRRVSRPVASGPRAASAAPMSRSVASRRRIRSHGQYDGAPPPSQARPHRTLAPGRDGLGADRVGERGLADARVAGDHEQATAPGERVCPGLGAARTARDRVRPGSPQRSREECKSQPGSARLSPLSRRCRRSGRACAPTACGACSSRARTPCGCRTAGSRCPARRGTGTDGAAGSAAIIPHTPAAAAERIVRRSLPVGLDVVQVDGRPALDEAEAVDGEADLQRRRVAAAGPEVREDPRRAVARHRGGQRVRRARGCRGARGRRWAARACRTCCETRRWRRPWRCRAPCRRARS